MTRINVKLRSEQGVRLTDRGRRSLLLILINLYEKLDALKDGDILVMAEVFRM